MPDKKSSIVFAVAQSGITNFAFQSDGLGKTVAIFQGKAGEFYKQIVPASVSENTEELYITDARYAPIQISSKAASAYMEGIIRQHQENAAFNAFLNDDAGSLDLSWEDALNLLSNPRRTIRQLHGRGNALDNRTSDTTLSDQLKPGELSALRQLSAQFADAIIKDIAKQNTVNSEKSDTVIPWEKKQAI